MCFDSSISWLGIGASIVSIDRGNRCAAIATEAGVGLQGHITSCAVHRKTTFCYFLFTCRALPPPIVYVVFVCTSMFYNQRPRKPRAFKTGMNGRSLFGAWVERNAVQFLAPFAATPTGWPHCLR